MGGGCLGVGHCDFLLTGRTLDLVATPKLVAPDVLPATGASEIKFCHIFVSRPRDFMKPRDSGGFAKPCFNLQWLPDFAAIKNDG
jgi:hypothetical protein